MNRRLLGRDIDVVRGERVDELFGPLPSYVFVDIDDIIERLLNNMAEQDNTEEALDPQVAAVSSEEKQARVLGYMERDSHPSAKEERRQKIRDSLVDRFTVHSLDSRRQIKVMSVREVALEFAIMIKEDVPESREQSLALTHLEEVVFWSVAGIARN